MTNDGQCVQIRGCGHQVENTFLGLFSSTFHLHVGQNLDSVSEAAISDPQDDLLNGVCAQGIK